MSCGFASGRGDRSRTCGLCVPNAALYQTELHLEKMAAEEGFEPSQTESESAVLPLHNSATSKLYLIIEKNICQCIFLSILQLKILATSKYEYTTKMTPILPASHCFIFNYALFALPKTFVIFLETIS